MRPNLSPSHQPAQLKSETHSITTKVFIEARLGRREGERQLVVSASVESIRHFGGPAETGEKLFPVKAYGKHGFQVMA